MKAERLRGRAGVAQRKRRMARTHWLCEHCPPHSKREATVVDHIVPLAHGGDDSDGNTRNLCKACNAKATAEQFGLRAPKRQISLSGWPEE